MLDRIRKQWLGAWAGFVTQHPGRVLWPAILAAVTTVSLTLWGMPLGGGRQIERLGFQSDRNQLISPDLDWNQRFVRWQTTFEGIGDLYVVVDVAGDNEQIEAGELERATAFVDELGPALDALDATSEVVWGFDPRQVDPKALRMASMDEVQSRLAQLRESRLLLESATPADLVNRIAARMTPGAATTIGGDPAAQIAGLRTLIDAMDAVLAIPVDHPIDFGQLVAGDAVPTWQYLASENGRHLYVRVAPVLEADAISAADDAIVATRRVLAEVKARHPDIVAGLTGVEVVEADETSVAIVDSTWASVVATVLITLLLVLAFHSWRIPVLAMAALLLGIAWSFGYVTLAIGHLQVLSVVFAVMLLGLGIAYGIHIASHYELIRHRFADTSQGFSLAMRETVQAVGPGLITGAVTTAAAFATVTFTDFQGLAEMGHIAAAGILLCLFAMLTVFPALMRKHKRRHHHVVPYSERRVHIFEERWVMPFARHPFHTVIGVMAVTALAAVLAAQVRYDYNLLNMLPRNIESVQWQKRLANAGGRALWFGVSIVDDLDEAKRLTEAYRAYAANDDTRTIEELGGVAMLFPPDEEAKLAMIDATRKQLQPALDAVLQGDAAEPSELDLLKELRRLRAMVTAFETLASASALGPHLQQLEESIGRVLDGADALPQAEREARLARLNREFAAWRKQSAQQIDATLDPAPLTIDALPAAVRKLYHAPKSGLYALEIYPHLPQGQTDPLAPEFLEAFVGDLVKVDPLVTGASPQYYYSGDLIWNAYMRAALYALIAVFILVLFDFGSIWDAVLSLVPVVVGFIWTLGIMWLIGHDLNPANIIVLPLVFGIGVDSGVHIIHRYRQDRVTRPLGLTAGTGKGITITTLTAMIGFASMIPSRHLGIRSLGFTLSLGLAMILLACWILMPAWLEIRERRQPQSRDESRQ